MRAHANLADYETAATAARVLTADNADNAAMAAPPPPPFAPPRAEGQASAGHPMTPYDTL